MSDTSTRTSGGSSTRRRGTVVEYDFAAPARLSREHARLLEIANETFARQWTTQLTSRLRCHAAVTFTGVSQSTYDAYVGSIPARSAMVPVVLDLGEPATAVLQLSTGTALAHLDHALGGPGGRDGAQPARELSEIETVLTLGMCTRAIGTLTYAFAALGSPHATAEGLQQDAQLLGAGRATDMVAVAQFSVHLGDHVDDATLMLPLAPLLARLTALAPQQVRTAHEVERATVAARTMRLSLPHVPVEVGVSMTGLQMPPEQVLGLAVGDVLRLSHPTARPLQVSVAGVPVARAVTTSRGPRRAALIVAHQEDHR